MYEYLARPVRKTLHFIVDYTVPRNGTIALISGGAGWYASRWAITWGLHDIIDLSNNYVKLDFLLSFFYSTPDPKNINWAHAFYNKVESIGKYLAVPLWGPEFADYAGRLGGVSAALITSFTLNLIAEGIFMIRRKKMASNEDLKAELIKMDFFQKPLTFAQLKAIGKTSDDSVQALMLPAPTLPPKIQTPEIQIQPEPPVHAVVEIPVKKEEAPPLPIKVEPIIPLIISQPIQRKERNELQEMLSELDEPCCGELLHSVKRVWESGKPDPVNQQLLAAGQSFV